jgi:uncharacterized protein involved in exopolysaccharide biosynthesis
MSIDIRPAPGTPSLTDGANVRPARASLPPAGAPEPSLLALAAVLLRNWRLLVAVPVATALIGLTIATIIGPRYVAESRIMPNAAQQQAGALAGLAARFGVNLGAMGGAGGESVDLYATLFRSREILSDAVRTTYSYRTADGDSVRTTLIALYDAGGSTDAERLRRAAERLRRDVSVSTDPKANTVTLRTDMPSPQLAELVNRRLLDLTDQFNQGKRQSRAASERAFVESRLAEAARELAGAEAAVEQFLASNRSFQESPQLSSQYARLTRRVDLRQSVYTSLAQSYEQARIDEVRDTPVSSVIDRPEGSARKAAGRALVAAVCLLLGAVVAVLLALGREYVRRQQEAGAPEYWEIRRVFARRRGGSGGGASGATGGDAAPSRVP